MKTLVTGAAGMIGRKLTERLGRDGADLLLHDVVPAGPGSVRLRQMAVAPSHQGQGLGRRLVEQVEPIARDRGIAEITLHARCEAEGFYTRLGYTRVGEEFMEIGVRHVEMRKWIGGD